MTETAIARSLVELVDYSKEMNDIFSDEFEFVCEEVKNGKEIPIEYKNMLKKREYVLAKMVGVIEFMCNDLSD